MRKNIWRLSWDRNNQSEACLVRLSSLFNHSSVQTSRIYLSFTDSGGDTKSIYASGYFYLLVMCV
jgi:hypothetical protein